MKQTSLVILTALLAATILAAQEKPARPNFSGSWVMVDSSDNSGTAGTDTPFMRIEHREPQLKVTIGPSVWSLTTDGAENTNRISGNEIKSRTHWQRDSLITEWTTEAGGKPVPHRQVWSLSPDGKRITLAMRDGENQTTVIAIRQ